MTHEEHNDGLLQGLDESICPGLQLEKLTLHTELLKSKGFPGIMVALGTCYHH